VLCGREGANGVADPDLLEAYTDSSAAFSSAGRKALRRQPVQSIRFAALTAGRRKKKGFSIPDTRLPSGAGASGAGASAGRGVGKGGSKGGKGGSGKGGGKG